MTFAEGGDARRCPKLLWDMADLTQGTYGRPFAPFKPPGPRRSRTPQGRNQCSFSIHLLWRMPCLRQMLRVANELVRRLYDAEENCCDRVSAAIAFAPLAAVAQTDQAAPGAAPAATDQGAMPAKPMKKKNAPPHEQQQNEKPIAPAFGRSRREFLVIVLRLASVAPLTSTAPSLGRGGFV